MPEQFSAFGREIPCETTAPGRCPCFKANSKASDERGVSSRRLCCLLKGISSKNEGKIKIIDYAPKMNFDLSIDKDGKVQLSNIG